MKAGTVPRVWLRDGVPLMVPADEDMFETGHKNNDWMQGREEGRPKQ